MRLYHLARELEFEDEQLMGILSQLGQPARSHLGRVDDNIAEMIRNVVKRDREKARQAAASAASAEESSTATSPAERLSPEERRRKELQEKRRKQEERKKRERERRERARRERREFKEEEEEPEEEEPSEIVLEPPVTVKDLSQEIGVKIPQLIKKLMAQGVMARINDPLDEETLQILGMEYGVDIEVQATRVEDLEAELMGPPDDEEDLVPRAPIITLLGHVDHGKTTLLDRIREADVAEGEKGGITQHIGAYRVTHDGSELVFLDTPGHEAFTEMRARGADVTDIVILVVAADDGVMPQTEEAIAHAKEAGVEIVVAVNKVDKANANPMKVRQQLSGHDLQPEDWGGETIFVDVSALQGEGIDDLLEMLSLQAEILELGANPDRMGRGTCLEAELTEGRGVVARFLVQNGTLRPGDVVLCGAGWGKIRAVIDEHGDHLDAAGPSTPVEVLGLSEVPEAGDRFYALENQSRARELAEVRQRRQREEELGMKGGHTTLESLRDRMMAEPVKEVRVIVKADVKGSVEVIQKALDKLGSEEVETNIIHSGVGGINESDVLLADASDAIIIGFQVVPDDQARTMAEEKGVSIRYYDVIYNLTDDVRRALEGILEPEEKEEVLGYAEVREIFESSSVGTIAGCYVTKGKITRSAKVRLIRESHVIWKGEIASLRRFQDDVSEVRESYECGVKLKGYDNVKRGDRLEAYQIVEVARTL